PPHRRGRTAAARGLGPRRAGSRRPGRAPTPPGSPARAGAPGRGGGCGARRRPGGPAPPRPRRGRPGAARGVPGCGCSVRSWSSDAPPDCGQDTAATLPRVSGMPNDAIRITGARQHNLRGFDLTVPRRAITAFTGVSGSGKTSLVFDTIAAEARRQLNETFTAFVRNRLPSAGRPDVDLIENLSPVVVIDQRRLGGNARSTVGTITDIYTLLRLLFSRAGTP